MTVKDKTTRELWNLCSKGPRYDRRVYGQELMFRTDTSVEARQRSHRECARRAKRSGTV